MTNPHGDVLESQESAFSFAASPGETGLSQDMEEMAINNANVATMSGAMDSLAAVLRAGAGSQDSTRIGVQESEAATAPEAAAGTVPVDVEAATAAVPAACCRQ